jgi:hypothetical protein
MHLLALAGYTLLTLVLTDPIAGKLFTEVPGGGDAWQHIWNLWWVKESLLDLHTNPYQTDLLYYPQGVNLYFHTLVLTAGLVGIPLQLLGFNLIATYNLVILSSFVLAGYGAFLLCRYLTANPWASFVGGTVFTFSPYHFAHVYGHMNLVSLQWIPFYVLLLLKALDAQGDGNLARGDVPSPRSGLREKHRGLWFAAGAGALLAVNAYTEWLYAIFLVILTGLLLAWRVLVPAERRLLAERVGWANVGLRIVVALGVFFLLVSPIFFPTLAEAGRGYAQQPPRETLVYSSDAVLAFTPSELHPMWGKSILEFANRLAPYTPMKHQSERVVFLGYTVLALAAYGLWRWRGRLSVLFWGFTALLTWLLSLGPILQLMGKSRFTVFEVVVPLPYLLLYKLPLFSIMRTPARLTVLTMLALAVVVAFAVKSLLDRTGRTESAASQASIEPITGVRALINWRGALALAVAALILFEFLSTPYPTVPPGWGVPIYSRIAQEPGRFALLELPLRPFGDYMAYQTVHGKPIVGGYLSRQPPYTLEQQEPSIKYLLDPTDPSDPIRDLVDEGAGADALRRLGVKYVIIRWWAFTAEQKIAMQSKLQALLGRPPDLTYTHDQVDVWQLSP